jgi:hypothetical protein
MDGNELRDRYMEVLLESITSVRYPSGEMLDRAEALCYTPEQASMLVEYLLNLIEASRYPSHQLMDRAERILFGIAAR